MTNRRRIVYGAGIAASALFGIIISLTTMAPVSGSVDGFDAGDLRRVCQQRLITNPPSAARLRTWLADCVNAMSTSQPISSPPVTTGPVTTTLPATTTPAPTTQPTTTSPPVSGFPSPGTTGVPAGWVPTTTRTGGWTITAPGTYTDIRVFGDIHIAVNDVTLRRVDVVDGGINTETASGCRHGISLEDLTVRPSGPAPLDVGNGAITPGGYTATRVKLTNVTEGFRSGGGSVGCGPVNIRDSFALIRSPADCHCDGLQVYDGAGTNVDGLTIDWSMPSGTTAFFAPLGEGGPVTINRLLLKGGGFALTDNIAGSVTNYFYVAGSAAYGAMDVNCTLVSPFTAHMGAINSSYQPVSSANLPCGAGAGQ